MIGNKSSRKRPIELLLSASVIAVTGFLRNKLLKIKPIKNKLML
jgi:hypothetical protein